jgi:hypothetical protein
VTVTKSILFLIVLGLMGLSSWLITRRSRRILGRALGREIREGEETSLKAWMAVPSDVLAKVPDELGGGPTERVLETMESMSRREHKPDTEHLSIR